MAWSYFTSYLSDGDLITKDMRDELLDAFEERALMAGATVDPTDLATVQSSRQLTDRVSITVGVSTYSKIALGEALRRISPFYLNESDNYNLFSDDRASASYILRVAALDLGYTESEYKEAEVSLTITTGSGSSNVYHIVRKNTVAHWNILRRAIQLLRWSVADYTDTRFSKGADTLTHTTWADARDDALSKSEVEGASGDYAILQARLRTDGYYECNVQRWVISFSVPAWVTSYKFGARLTGTVSSEVVAAAKITDGVATHNFILTAPNDAMNVISDAIFTTTGATSVSIQHLGYNDSAALDVVEPTSVGTIESWLAVNLGPGFFLGPSFTHPYEEITP